MLHVSNICPHLLKTCPWLCPLLPAAVTARTDGFGSVCFYNFFLIFHLPVLIGFACLGERCLPKQSWGPSPVNSPCEQAALLCRSASFAGLPLHSGCYSSDIFTFRKEEFDF